MKDMLVKRSEQQRKFRARRDLALGRLLDRVVPGVAALFGAVLYAVAHHQHPLQPVAGAVPNGWFTWFDAGRYLRAALAWTRFDLRASEHWYPPGYPVLGALGHAFTPVQPFYLPDLFALAGSAWLFALLAAELLGRRPGARCLGALVFLATTGLNGAALEVWVTPWSTTPATPAIYGCLLAGMRFAGRPRAWTCFWAGLAGGSIALFRPTEAAIVLLAVGLAAGLAMVSALVGHRVGLRQCGRIVAMGLVGAGLPGLALVGGEYATGGFGPGGYLAVSQAFGFEWRLIPLHWAEIFGDPRPLWPGEQGIVTAFWWIVPGVAGMAVALACGLRATRANHALLVGAAVLHILVFLGYRDMHPNQVWWIFLYHYFKWVLPVLGLYAALLAGYLAGYLAGGRRLVAVAVAVVSIVGLFGWRPELVAVSGSAGPAVRLDAHSLRLPDGLGSVWDAVAVPAAGSFDAVFHDIHALVAGGHVAHAPFDFRAFPRAGGLLLLPVRGLPDGDTVIRFSPEVTIGADDAPFVGRQRLRFGVPCWIEPSRAVCDPEPLFAGPVLPIGRTVEFRSEGAAYRGTGWSAPEAIGCWTDGDAARLSFRVPDRGQRDVVLELHGYGYGPGVAVVTAGGRAIGALRPGARAGLLRVVIPGERFGPAGQISLRLLVDEPRRPVDFGEGGDRRRLGLMVEWMRIVLAD